MNTEKAMRIKENNYDKGNMKTNLSLKIKNKPVFDINNNSKIYIKTQNEIEKTINPEDKEKYRKIDRKKNYGIEVYNPLCNRSIAVRESFNSSNMSYCLSHINNIKDNINNNLKYKRKSCNFNDYSSNYKDKNFDSFKCNSINVDVLKDFSKINYKASNKNLNSKSMKDSLKSPI